MKPTLLAMAAILLFASCHSHDPPRDYIATDEIKAIMKYHGTHTLYEDWDGKLWFKRDNDNGNRLRGSLRNPS